MDEEKIEFSVWLPWERRAEFTRREPGIYLLAHFESTPPRGPANPLAREIIYVGETCGQTVLKRLAQFHRSAFIGRDAHSGGRSYFRTFTSKRKASPLHVAVWYPSKTTQELRPLLIRHVERKLIWEYAKRHSAAPLLNLK